MKRAIVLAALCALTCCAPPSHAATDAEGTLVNGISAGALMQALGTPSFRTALYREGWTLRSLDRGRRVQSLTISVFPDAKQARERFEEACRYMSTEPVQLRRKPGDAASAWASKTGAGGTIHLVRDNVAASLLYSHDLGSAVEAAAVLDNSIVTGTNGVRRGKPAATLGIAGIPDRIAALPGTRVRLHPRATGSGPSAVELVGFCPNSNPMRVDRDGALTFQIGSHQSAEQLEAGMLRVRMVVGSRCDLRVVIRDIPLVPKE